MPVKLIEGKHSARLPRRKVSGVITKSKLFRDAIEALGAGKEFKVSVPEGFLGTHGITDPVTSFKVSLARYAHRNKADYVIYAVAGIVYAVPKKRYQSQQEETGGARS